MKITDIKKHIEELLSDIEFSYSGSDGSICPINAHEIYLCFDGDSYTAASVDDAMNKKFIDGKSLLQIGDKLDIY